MSEPGAVAALSREEILQAIEEVAREHVGLLEDVRFDPGLRLVEDLTLDSIQLLTLAVEVENRFRICMDPEDEEGIETVGDLADVVARKMAEDRPEREESAPDDG